MTEKSQQSLGWSLSRKSLGPERQLQRRGHIRLPGRRNDWEIPPLVLHERGDAETRSRPKFRADVRVSQRAAVGNELRADFLVPESKLEFVARAEPVGGPSLSALSLPPHPTPHQMFGILKTGDPGRIPVKSAECDVGPTVGRIGIAAFDAEIQFRDPGQPRNVYSGEPGRDIRAKNRSDFVMFRKTIGVEGHSIPQSRNSITEIHSRPARSRLVGVAGERVTRREQTPQEGMQS